jgi:hypothetical protein
VVAATAASSVANGVVPGTSGTSGTVAGAGNSSRPSGVSRSSASSPRDVAPVRVPGPGQALAWLDAIEVVVGAVADLAPEVEP